MPRGRVDIDALPARVADHSIAVPSAMPVSEFPTLLALYMRRIRASAAGIASEIGMSREAVNNWRHGDALPSRRHRDKVLACARYLRLSEAETDGLLSAGGFEPEFPAESALGAAAPPAAVRAVLDRLDGLQPYPILMLLSQAHLGQPPQREALLDAARRRYGGDCVWHLQPPYSLGGDARDYFAAIGLQCGLTGIGSDFDFEAALAQRLRSGARLFCLVSRFEQGDPVQREVLAGILRSLSEMYSGCLHLLICGGAALADLKYRGGDLSLLNIATAEHWPELGVEEVHAMAARRQLPCSDATRVLRLAGGHPLLVDAVLALLAAEPGADDDALESRLSSHAPLWPGWLAVLEPIEARPTIADWLQRTRLVPARPYLIDPLLRALFWSNLIVARPHREGAWLEWRCAAIRRAGLTVLEQISSGPA